MHDCMGMYCASTSLYTRTVLGHRPTEGCSLLDQMMAAGQPPVADQPCVLHEHRL